MKDRNAVSTLKGYFYQFDFSILQLLNLDNMADKVTIEGYEIKSGKNFMGRADDMDIQVLGDNKISRRNHGVIVFDPKKKETVLLPGESNGIVYHNDAAVYTPTVLNPYDVIEMGDSKFVFVPFCGENFMWENNQETAGEKI